MRPPTPQQTASIHSGSSLAGGTGTGSSPAAATAVLTTTLQRRSVLISGTTRDLPDHRQQVMDACLRMGMFPKTMEQLPASEADAIRASLELVDDVDIYVGIFAFRYGYVPPGHDISIAEMEYNRAVERDIPRLIFLMHQDHMIKPSDVEIGAGAERLAKLKERLKKEQVVNFFKSPEDLRAQVINSLSQYRRPDVAPQSLHQLPPPPPDFTGRESELAALRAAIKQAGATICGLLGQAGVGKTALALKLVQQVAPQYPDAQIFVDLRGVSEKPLSAAEAMAYVLRAFHPEAKLPESVNDLRPIYLSALSGKHALLVMDNARDTAQVAPLVPPAGSALLITSRFHFVVPGMLAMNLDTLPPADAKALLIGIAPRIDGEANAIADLCGYLPLALRLAATALAERVDLSPADYRQRLEKQRLKALGGVEASIGLSYGLLDPETQKHSRMLAVFPESFDAVAAAAVWEMEGDAAQDVLSRLVQYSLLEWNDATRRYRCHGLVRDFVRTRLLPDERETAYRRHAHYYVDVLREANNLYLKGGESLKSGLALFDIEWGNVQAGQAWAVAHTGRDDEATRLCSHYPNVGAYCLELRQHPREHIKWREAALTAARRLGDRYAEGVHLGNLGLAYDSLGEYRRAIEYNEQYLAIAREKGDRRDEGAALGNLGIAYDSLGQYRRAIEYYEKQLAIAHEIGDRRGEGYALGNLGIAYRGLGEYRRAIEYQEQSLTIKREIGDRLGEGQALGNLGLAYHNLGDYRRAIEHSEQQLAIAREIGHQQGEGNALWNMSLVLDKLAKRGEAITRAEEALGIYEKIESPVADKVRKQLEHWGKK